MKRWRSVTRNLVTALADLADQVEMSLSDVAEDEERRRALRSPEDVQKAPQRHVDPILVSIPVPEVAIETVVPILDVDRHHVQHIQPPSLRSGPLGASETCTPMESVLCRMAACPFGLATDSIKSQFYADESEQQGDGLL